jgi:hypothetical protein
MGVTIPTFQRHISEIEQRLDALERRVHAFEQHREDLVAMRQLLGDLSYGIEELQEA